MNLSIPHESCPQKTLYRACYRYIALFLASAFFLFMPPAHGSDYFSMEEYHRIHPEQDAISQQFSGIVGSPGTPADQTLQEKKVTISFIYPGEQASDYWRRSIVSFKARMDEIGIRHTINEYFSKPVVDYRMQERQIKAALETDPDYLVFTLDVKKHQRIIERIITKRRPKLILQNITTPLKSWEGKQPFLYVGFDHAEGSRLIADYFIQRTQGEGRYALLYFSQGYVSEMRGDSLAGYLRLKSNLVPSAAYYTNGDRVRSRKAALEILNDFPDIRFIYACSTDVALGAIEALGISGSTGRVMINGWGGGSSELDAIERREMDVTVMRMNDDNGVAMAEAVRLDAEGRASAVPRIFSGDFALIEKGITPHELDALKKRAFRYSGVK